MRKSKLNDEHIEYAIKQSELSITVEEVCRRMGISSATFYKWRQKCGRKAASPRR
jgi:putative transposase